MSFPLPPLFFSSLNVSCKGLHFTSRESRKKEFEISKKQLSRISENPTKYLLGDVLP